MILTADVHAIADDCRRRIGLETGLVLPDKRAVARIQTIDAVIQVANHQTIANHRRRRLRAIDRLVAPDKAAVLSVEAVDVTSCRSEINPILHDGRLTGPT